MRMQQAMLALGLWALVWQAAAAEDPLAQRRPGVQQDGLILLPNQWSLAPVGKQIELGDFPVQIALHPSEPWAAVLHAGYGTHEVVVVDLVKRAIVSRVTLPQAFYGLAFDPQGNVLFASGGEHGVVHRFAFRKGYLGDRTEIALAQQGRPFVPGGMACDPEGRELFVANTYGHSLAAVALDRSDAVRYLELEAESFPYTVLPSPDGKRLYVSLWGRAAVAVIDRANLSLVELWQTDLHPTELALSPDQNRLFAACANSNVVVVLDTTNGKPQETISAALYPRSPPGTTPNSLSLSGDGKVLWIANADNNNLAVFDVSEPGHSRPLGYIPVGWYPTSVRVDPRNQYIYVANAKGLSSRANPQGPQPGVRAPQTVEQYIGSLFQGTLAVIVPPSPQDMQRYTELAYRTSPLNAEFTPPAAPTEENHPIPARLGQQSPIKYCVYIIKENRTYDQVFGDMPEGNGDPNLCIFPERVTPNHHALAREFVLLDNFYVESEVSADGHEWSMAAYATDFVEKSWPLVYRPGGKDILKYPAEGTYDIATPAGGYIWDRCLAAGVSFRSYGEFVDNGPTPDAPGTAAVPGIEGHFDPQFRSFDLDYPDVKRAQRFIEELKRFEAEGELPRLIILRLPNDHTAGLRAGKPTPTAMVADNDLALGMVVEALSHSKFWPQLAIFVVEDDAQNGPDHVDAHRTVALVVSPYCRRGVVDSSMYSTASMLRTIELILGLEPMSQFDAAARPMYASFQAKPDLTPYVHRPANVDLSALNPTEGWGAELSATLDLNKEDRADDLLLNELIWKSVRGLDSTMPAPVRASFVFALPDDEDD